eukprot:749869-Hanusia_phi.AAC.1
MIAGGAGHEMTGRRERRRGREGGNAGDIDGCSCIRGSKTFASQEGLQQHEQAGPAAICHLCFLRDMFDLLQKFSSARLPSLQILWPLGSETYDTTDYYVRLLACRQLVSNFHTDANGFFGRDSLLGTRPTACVCQWQDC